MLVKILHVEMISYDVLFGCIFFYHFGVQLMCDTLQLFIPIAMFDKTVTCSMGRCVWIIFKGV